MIGEALSGLDAWTAGRVVVSAGFYGAALFAVGGLLFRFAFPALPFSEARAQRRASLAAAWAGIGLVLLLWPLQAAYLGGGSLAAARDPILLRIVVDSAQGHRLGLAVAGLLLLQAGLLEGRWLAVRLGVSLIGAALVLLAFAQVGHTRGDPRQGGCWCSTWASPPSGWPRCRHSIAWPASRITARSRCGCWVASGASG